MTGKVSDTAKAVESPLEILRKPFLANQISQKPQGTKAQNDAVKADYKKGIRCKICGQWHHPEVVHLDYVGHAALTDRLLDADLSWNWKPLALTPEGLPAFDRNGGLWIELTVDGVTRLGYGSADGKTGGDAVKEIIGDALRNSGMRFGAALDLWHKGDLHADDDAAVEELPPARDRPVQGNGNGKSTAKIFPEPSGGWGDWVRDTIGTMRGAQSIKRLDEIMTEFSPMIPSIEAHDVAMANDLRKEYKTQKGVMNGDIPV